MLSTTIFPSDHTVDPTSGSARGLLDPLATGGGDKSLDLRQFKSIECHSSTQR